MAVKDKINILHEAVAKELLERVESGEATAAELSAAIKFLKDNGGAYGAITTDSPGSNILDKLPYPVASDILSVQ